MKKATSSTGPAKSSSQEPANVSPLEASLARTAKLKSDATLKQCFEVIEGIDSMCQIQLGQIGAVISTMLRAAETPEFWQHPLDLKEQLGLIHYLTADLMDYVNGSAETVGCNHYDDIEHARDRRVRAALEKAIKAEVRHG